MPQTEIILSTVGTVGDSSPFLAMAEAFSKRGRKVCFMSNADHAGEAAAAGIPFEAISDPDWPQIGRNDSAFFREVIAPGYQRAYNALKSKVAFGTKHLLINRNANWGIHFAAELLSIPTVRIVLQPSSVWQGGHPVDLADMSLLNAFRTRIGLPALAPEMRLQEPAVSTLSFFPDWFGQPQSAWPLAGRCIGFPFSVKTPSKLPPQVERLIARSGPPVVFSIGSGVQEVAPYLAVAEEFCRRSRYAVLFLSRHAASLISTLPEQMIVLPHLDHSAVLPRAAAAVHNGGIGTVAQCFRAGTPQVIVPLVYDQPDNAERVERLGVGCKISPGELTGELLTEKLRSFMGEPGLSTRIREIAIRIRNEDAVPNAVDAVEEMLARSDWSETA